MSTQTTRNEPLDRTETKDASLPPEGTKARQWIRDVVFLILGGLISIPVDSWRDEKQRIDKLNAALGKAAQHMESGQPDQIRKAADIYEQSLGEIRRDKEPLRYANAKRQLGIGHLILSEDDEQNARLEDARLAFEEALAIYQQEENAAGSARTRGHLAATYLQLGDLANRETNLRLALKLAEQASPGLAGLLREDIENQINLCKIHRRMAESSLDGSALTHLSSGLEAANHALGKLAGTGFHSLQSKALICRGNIFLARSHHEEKGANLIRAINDYESAREFSTLESNAYTFAEIQSNIGSALTYLAEVEERSSNLHKAIDAYSQSLEAYPKKHTLRLAMTRSNMAGAYRSLAEVEERLGNLGHALVHYRMAAEDLTAAEYKYPYATIQADIGRTFCDVAKIQRKAANYREAIAHYQKALNVFKEATYPAWYAQVQLELGGAFENLAAVEDRQKNLLDAWKCYRAAMDKLPPEEYEALRKTLQAKLTRLEARLGVATEDAAREL